jgi:hypothetical protein
MKRTHVFAALAAMAIFAFAQETTRPAVQTYASIADTILSAKAAEKAIVMTILDGHRHAAEGEMRRGAYEAVAANMALFANEGDNAVAGIRKRLLEGGHHHHADDEAKGIYEPGYVVVTKEAKAKCLELSAAFRKATTDAERKKVWDEFADLSAKLLAGE